MATDRYIWVSNTWFLGRPQIVDFRAKDNALVGSQGAVANQNKWQTKPSRCTEKSKHMADKARLGIAGGGGDENSKKDPPANDGGFLLA